MKPRLDIPRGWKTKDGYAPDGIRADGWRIVRTGGVVRFAGVVWQHEALKAHEGETVFCTGQDYWQQVCSFYTQPGSQNMICEATPKA